METDDTFDAALRIMDGMGLTEAFGHLSERVPGKPGCIRITPAKGPGIGKSSESIYFNLKGARLSGGYGGKAPLETPMHLAIYRARPDVNAICRTHSPFAVSVGAVESYVPTLHGFSLMLGRTVPVHKEIDLIYNEENGAGVAETLGKSTACLIRGNGALATGADLKHAVVHAIYLEEACRIATHMGIEAAKKAAAAISDEDFARRCQWHGNEAERAWDYYREKYFG